MVVRCGCGDKLRLVPFAIAKLRWRSRGKNDLNFKLKAFESAEKTSKEAAARQFGVDTRRIRKWHRHVAASTALARHAVQVKN